MTNCQLWEGGNLLWKIQWSLDLLTQGPSHLYVFLAMWPLSCCLTSLRLSLTLCKNTTELIRVH